MKKIPCISFALLYFFCSGNSQVSRPNNEFGDVRHGDFKSPLSTEDSTSGALYLFNKGMVRYIKNDAGFFDVQFTHFARIRLLKNSSFSDLGDLRIPLLIQKNYVQKLLIFKARIYNVENGQLKSTFFDKMDLMEE